MELTFTLISFESKSTMKRKLGQILVSCMRTISNMFLAGDWKLVPDPLMILLKRHYSKIWPFLINDIYHF